MRVYLPQVDTYTFLTSQYEEQKEVKMAQGVAGTDEDEVNSNVQVRRNFCGHSAFWETLNGYICMPPSSQKEICKLLGPKNKYESQTPNKSSFT